MQRGFSLLELSIVLVIIGLIAGGIVAGASMIRAAELRAVITEQQQYLTAVHTFRDKYLGLPGDLKNATAFWGDNVAACADAVVADGTPGTCNGDGNTKIPSGSGVAGTTAEEFQFWHQLSLAGLINGNFTGITSDIIHTPGENTPISKLSGGTWRVRHLGDLTGTVTGTLTSSFALQYGNIMESIQQGSFIYTPAEAWNFDKKLDDGKPAHGKVIARPWDSNCTTAASRTDLAGEYDLSQDSKECIFMLRNVF